MQLLSDDWFAAAQRALAEVEAPDGERVVIGQVVTDGPNGTVAYRLEVEDGRVRLERGDDGAAVTLTMPWRLAREIATGQASAQQAVLSGELQLVGDPRVLVAHTEIAGAVAAALSSLEVD